MLRFCGLRHLVTSRPSIPEGWPKMFLKFRNFMHWQSKANNYKMYQKTLRFVLCTKILKMTWRPRTSSHFVRKTCTTATQVCQSTQCRGLRNNTGISDAAWRGDSKANVSTCATSVQSFEMNWRCSHENFKRIHTFRLVSLSDRLLSNAVASTGQ